MLEQALRQSLLMSNESFLIFVTDLIFGTPLGVACLLLLSNLLPYVRSHRKEYEEFEE
jgi:TctA family transporter